MPQDSVLREKSEEYYGKKDYLNFEKIFLEIADKAANCSDEHYLNNLLDLVSYLVEKQNTQKALSITKSVLAYLDKNAKPHKYNIFLNIKEILEGKTKLESFPQTLFIEISGKCNIKCIMCALHHKQYAEMSESRQNDLVKMFTYASEIMWLGGEPTLNKNLSALIEKAHIAGVSQTLITNGTMLDRRMIEKLIECKVGLTLSIDGHNKEIYEKIRVGGKFETITDNLNIIKELKKSSPKFRTTLHVVVLNENHKHLYELADMTKYYNFNCVMFFSNGIKGYGYNQETVDYVNKHKDKISDGLSKADIFSAWIGNFDPQNIDKPMLGSFDASNAQGKQNIICYQPWNSFFYSMENAVKPGCGCTILDKSCHDGASLQEMWNGTTMRMYRKKMLEGDTCQFCGQCSSNEGKNLYIKNLRQRAV
jgi:MoaA/NifB/PqqE/SkfB family radical SAM enzyme